MHIIYYEPEEECNHSLEEEYIWGFVLFSKYFCSSLNYLHPALCVAWRIFLVVSVICITSEYTIYIYFDIQDLILAISHVDSGDLCPVHV